MLIEKWGYTVVLVRYDFLKKFQSRKMMQYYFY